MHPEVMHDGTTRHRHESGAAVGDHDDRLDRDDDDRRRVGRGTVSAAIRGPNTDSTDSTDSID
jgi:hypothetical protein